MAPPTARSRRAVALSLVACTALTGCASIAAGRSPASTPPESSAPAPSPEPTVVGGRAGVPDNAKRRTRASAKEFARYYMNLVNTAWMQADPTLLEGLAEPECGICNWWVERAEELKKDNKHVASQVVTIGAFKNSKQKAFANEEVFRVDCVQLKHHTVDLFGAITSRQDRERLSADVWLVWDHNEWYFRGWEVKD